MNMDMILRTIFKFAGIGEEQMRATMATTVKLIVDGERQIREINARLERIEAHLGIPKTTINDHDVKGLSHESSESDHGNKDR